MLLKVLSFLYKQIMYLIVPPFCVYCKQWLSERLIFCMRCNDLIQPIVSTQIAITASVSMSIFAISPYQEPLKSLILAKLQSQRLSSLQLGALMWELTSLDNLNFDFIVPIPLHWTRYAHRGYNQAEVIASIIAQKSGKPLVNLLKRRKRTLFQAQLSVEERSLNLQDAFDLTISQEDLKRYSGKIILLVDDLMTTGSTFKTAAKKLLLVKPANIYGVVACRTL